MTRPPKNVLQIKTLLEGQSAASVSLHETSKSWIFLGADQVYKLKKRIRDDLQDLTSLRARFDNCVTEIDLNRRLAPDTYLGLYRVVRHPDGQLGLGGTAETVDWLIKMRCLPADQMLDVVAVRRTHEDAGLRATIIRIADQLCAFYTTCPASNLNPTELATLALDQHEMNLATLRHPLFKEHHSRFEAVNNAFKTAFFKHLNLFEARVAGGWVRECHGDLRPEHICLTEPPIIFDCLEFNRNLRLVDPFSEITFLGMEAEVLGASWIKPILIDTLKNGLSDNPDPKLLGLYEVMHALMRTRICLAHLLVSKPRTPEKWLPLGLQYFELAERRLRGPKSLAH
jgi:aminoglycoside phosphotransferase family enzyme